MKTIITKLLIIIIPFAGFSQCQLIPSIKSMDIVSDNYKKIIQKDSLELFNRNNKSQLTDI